MAVYSVVVPVYNSEKSLVELYERIIKVFAQYDEDALEIILVDDFSKDDSYLIMKTLKNADDRVVIVQLAKNCGQHAALLCGLSVARGDYIITMDDDLQHPPEEIPKLISCMEKLGDKVDVVIGKYEAKKHGIIRNLGTKLSSYISYKVYGKPKNLELTSFRLLKKNVVEDLLSLHIDIPRIGNMIVQVNGRIVNVTVEHDERKYGKSGYSFSRLVKDLINNLLMNSSLPLILVRNMGIFSFVFSLFMIFWYLYRYIFRGVSIVGWTTVVLLILLFGGIVLFALGIIGDYLIKILNQSRNNPSYYIRNKD